MSPSPSDSPSSNDSKNSNILHCRCCPFHRHEALSNKLDDDGAFHSDNSTVNDTVSEYGHSYRPIPGDARTRHSHMKSYLDTPPQYPVPTDSFDYEQKYAPDDEYKEMSENARVFKTYMDECIKIDFDMVESWRDSLDMIFVFAALFSIVLTTLVVQSSQSLRVNYAEVTTILMLRLIDIQTAISLGDPAPQAQNSNPSASFRAKSRDLWVNGLWFTSLVLSLTTMLIAVLTKQWINEYMIIPSGTPRERARIRHFRFIGLQQWRVPLIVGILPILMHVSLGAFLAGFLIFVYSLSGTMGTALSCVTGMGALAYLISSVLPLFYANCPYKTPVASYTFRLVSWMRRRVGAQAVIPRSLKDVERVAISHQEGKLDALAIAWLHNASSNASVQSVAIQSLGSLPLQSIPTISGPDGITAPVSDPLLWRFLDVIGGDDKDRPTVIRAIRAHHRIDQPVDRLERMQRAALRFGKFYMANRRPNKYDFIYHRSPVRSIDAVRESLLGEGTSLSQNTTFDVVFWGKIFETALQSGLNSLEIAPLRGDGPLSPVWCQLLKCAVQHHICSLFDCKGDSPALFSYSLGPERFPLVISHYVLEENGTSATLSEALTNNMRPSFVRWVIHVAFPYLSNSASRSPLYYTQHVPDDVLLVLALLQTRSVQLTSRQSSDSSLFRKVLEMVREYVFNTGHCGHHKDIDRAAIYALRSVVKSDDFGTGAIMSLADEAFLVEALFNGLNRRVEFSGPGDRDATWLTPTLFDKIWRVVSAAPKSKDVHNGWRTVAHVFAYVSHFPTHMHETETIFLYLLDSDWLRDLGFRFSRLAKSATPESDGLPDYWCPGYIFIAAIYIDVLFARPTRTTEAFNRARAYIKDPTNLSTLARVLLVSGSDTQNRLWRLAEMMFEDTSCDWVQCLADLAELAACKGIEDEYKFIQAFLGVDVHANTVVQYRPVNDLPALVARFAADCAQGKFSPPVYATRVAQDINENSDTKRKVSFLERWRRLLRQESPA